MIFFLEVLSWQIHSYGKNMVGMLFDMIQTMMHGRVGMVGGIEVHGHIGGGGKQGTLGSRVPPFT
jgi:hypothetical protein